MVYLSQLWHSRLRGGGGDPPSQSADAAAVYTLEGSKQKPPNGIGMLVKFAGRVILYGLMLGVNQRNRSLQQTDGLSPHTDATATTAAAAAAATAAASPFLGSEAVWRSFEQMHEAASVDSSSESGGESAAEVAAATEVAAAAEAAAEAEAAAAAEAAAEAAAAAEAVSDAYNEWRLPGVDAADAALPAALRRGKEFLALKLSSSAAAAGGGSTGAAGAAAASSSSPSRSTTRQGLRALAAAVSRGSTDEFVGLDISLTHISPFEAEEASLTASRAFRITSFLGDGAANAVLEITDKTTKEKLAMRILYTPYSVQSEIERLTAFGSAAMQMEEKLMLHACGGLAAAAAAAEKGIAIHLFTAEIEGLPDVVVSGEVFVFKRVQVMQRMQGDVANLLLDSHPVPIEAKEYIAARLLLQVLHLHSAGVCHNDLKLENCFLREDGSFLVGDFGSSTLVGMPLNGQITDITPVYGEPRLMLDIHRALSNKCPAMPHQKSDLWSLGVAIYELFMDGDLPFGLEEFADNAVNISAQAEAILNIQEAAAILQEELQKAHIPARWRELLCRLLEPKRARRIDSREIAVEFRDLYAAQS